MEGKRDENAFWGNMFGALFSPYTFFGAGQLYTDLKLIWKLLDKKKQKNNKNKSTEHRPPDKN